tara:strand:- start:734 stop:988 length:255 start_codon:yes stop_codon:yes gene_type:complete
MGASVNVFLWIVFAVIAYLHMSLLFGFTPFDSALTKKLRNKNKKTNMLLFVLINLLIAVLELAAVYFAMTTRTCVNETIILTSE